MKDIKNFEGLYAVTEQGQVWSYKRNRFLKPYKTSSGYYQVKLQKDGQTKSLRVHRLVAEAFIENTENKPYVNHKDENPLNNNVDNLEWVTAKENNNYGNHNARVKATKQNMPQVYCAETDTVYKTAATAAKALGLITYSVNAVCKGNQRTTGGYHFKYIN